MSYKFFNRQFSLATFTLALLFTGLYSCSEKISSDAAPINKQANVAPVASVLKSASILPDVQVSSVTLWAGQTINAGTVTVSQTDTNGDLVYDAFKVEYNLANGWMFKSGTGVTEQVKFYLGTSASANESPGLFPFKYTVTGTFFSATFSFTTFGFTGCNPVNLYIAAHADLTNGTQTETGWGSTESFTQGWSESKYFTFNLSDKTPPTASDVALAIECIGDVPGQDVGVITDANDNCALASVPVTFVGESSEGTCPTVITRSYLVTDAAGNTKAVKFTITVDDKTPPVFDALPVIQSVACLSEDVFVTPTATDNCDENPIVAITSDVVTSTSKTRTWTATDQCGNQSSVSATVSLDVTPPSFSGVAASGTVLCEVTDPFTANPSLFTTPVASDNYDNNPVVTVADITEPIGTSIVWYTRTWTATDKCGNSVAVSQKLVKECGGFGPTGFPFDYMKGAGTGWAYDVSAPSMSLPFSSLANKVSNNWGWTNGKISKGTIDKYFVLYVGAGQSNLTKGAPVGYVKVSYTGNVVNFQYWVISACNITGIHFYAGTTQLPKNKKGQFISAPGQLGVSQTGLSGSVTLPSGTGDIYVAAHADVVLN